MGDPKPLASLSSTLLARKGAARPAMRRQVSFAPSPAAADGSSHEDLGWNDMGYDVNPPQSSTPTSIAGEDGAEDGRKVNPLAGAIPEVVKQQDALNRKLQESADSDLSQEDQSEYPAEPVADTSVSDASPERAIGSILSRKPGATHPVMPKAVEAPIDTAQQAQDSIADNKTAEKPTNKAVLSHNPKRLPANGSANSKIVASGKAPLVGKRAAFTLRLDAQRHLRLRLACAVLNQSAQQLVTQALDEMLADLPEIDALAGQLPGSEKKH